MNAPKLPGETLRRFRPVALLLGLLAGFAILSWKGREVATFDWHAGFTRFHPLISPEAMYEPTVGEMAAIVRARCRPDQVLVIVGGNSILLGVGQPAEKMWTLRLQEALGDRYAVVNLAFRGAAPNDAGAVVAEALRTEFPRLIYVANCAPFQSASPVGQQTYEFALLDAAYKGLLLPWAPRDRVLWSYLRTTDYRDYRQMDLELGAKLDSWLYFRNLWNWWSFNHGFTFATSLLPHDPQAHWPRNRFKDEEDDFDAVPFEARFNPQVVATDLEIARLTTAAFYHAARDGSWTRDPVAFKNFMRGAREAFPDPLKPRTLLLVGRNSPYYTRQLGGEVRSRDERAIADTVSGLKSLGYDSIDTGGNFTVEDYGDRTHLTSSGGAKLALTVAPEIRLLAQKLKFVEP